MAGSTYLRPEFVEPRSGFATPFDQGKEQAGFRSTVTYYNNLSSRVTVALRDGVKFDIPPASNIKLAREFVIRQELVFGQDIVPSLNNILHSVAADQNVTMRLVRENLTDGYGERYGSKKTILEYAVTEAAINDAGGKIYLHDLDIAIGIPSRYNFLIHPYSVEGRDMDISTYQGNREARCFPSIDIEYVSHTTDQRPIYTRFADKVLMIKPNLNMHQKHGLYIKLESVVLSPGSAPQSRVIYIESDDWDEMEQHGLFRTFEQAEHGPSFEVAQKQKLAEKQSELERLKLSLQEANANLELEKAAIKREQMRSEALNNEIKTMSDSFRGYQDHHLSNEERRRKAEYDEEDRRRRMESDRRKDDYEERSLRRKEESELIKYLPSIIVGIGTIFMAIKSLMPPKSK